jgi:hypothetical protein
MKNKPIMQSTQLKSVILLGVTGPNSFGQFVVRELAKQKQHFNRIAVYHDTSRPTDEPKKALLDSYLELGIEIVPSDGYQEPGVFFGFDCVLSFLGNHALKLQPAIFDVAIQAGVRHFYPSEYGADLLVGSNWTQRYYRDKVFTRVWLETKIQEVSGLGWTYIQNGRLAEWSITKHFGIDNANASAKIYGTGYGRQSLISANDAAAYVVASLKTLARKDERRTFRLSSASLTYNDIFSILQKITGRNYDVTYIDVEAATGEERGAQARGDVDAELSASHKLIQGLEGTLLPEPWDNDKFPEVQPLGVEEALRREFEKNPLIGKLMGWHERMFHGS